MKKLLSRKFWYPILYGLLVYANRRYSLGINDTDIALVGGVATSYIIGESINDARYGMFRPQGGDK
jgi:hypothetical protein